MAIVVGIDPGLTGAVAAVTGEQLLWAEDTPTAGGEIAVPLLLDLIKSASPDLVAIERVGSMPKQGVASTFKFGTSYGIAIGLTGALWRTVRTTPTEWKAEYRLNGKDKDAARLLAIQLWPTQAEVFARKGKGQARADAALIALHAARHRHALTGEAA